MKSTFVVFWRVLLGCVVAWCAGPAGAVPWTVRLDAPAAREVFLAGEMTRWDAGKQPMTRGPDGRWSLSLDVPAGLWLYKFVVDGRWIEDPANPLSDNDGQGGRHSILLLGDGEWRVPDSAPRGRVLSVEVPSAAWGAPSRYHVYLPPGQTADRPVPLLLLLHGLGMDADQWLRTGLVDRYMDSMIAAGRIRPFAIAMPSSGKVPYTGRSQAFLLDELLPRLQKDHGVTLKPADTAVAGMSMGGFGAFHLGLQKPQRFGLVVSMSAPFSTDYLASLPDPLAPPFQLALLSGTEDAVLANNQDLAGLLKAGGFRFFYEQSAGGHDWHYWSGQTPAMLQRASDFFGGTKLPTNSRPLTFAKPALPRPGEPARASVPVGAGNLATFEGRWRGTWKLADGSASGRFAMEVEQASPERIRGVLHWYVPGSSEFENVPFDEAPLFADGLLGIAGVPSGRREGRDPGLRLKLEQGADGPVVSFTTHSTLTPSPVLNEVRKVR